MKKAIELLEKARDLAGCVFTPMAKDTIHLTTAINCIESAIAVLQTPRWETPEQYKGRTGEPWPDDGPVWINFKTIGGSWNGWELMTCGTAFDLLERLRRNGQLLMMFIICACSGQGRPPDNWRPGEAQDEKGD